MWFMNGNTFFEFDDHITMVEANRTDAALQAILQAANALVPGKRVTQVIQSHHHFDHSAGLRAAVARGADDHLAPGERGYLPRDGGASGQALSRRARPESQALDVHSR